MTPRTITVERLPEGGFEVHSGHRSAGELTFDEMLGQVVHLMHPDIDRPRYPEFTWQERAEGLFSGRRQSTVRHDAAVASFRGEAWA